MLFKNISKLAITICIAFASVFQLTSAGAECGYPSHTLDLRLKAEQPFFTATNKILISEGGHVIETPKLIFRFSENKQGQKMWCFLSKEPNGKIGLANICSPSAKGNLFAGIKPANRIGDFEVADDGTVLYLKNRHGEKVRIAVSASGNISVSSTAGKGMRESSGVGSTGTLTFASQSSGKVLESDAGQTIVTSVSESIADSANVLALAKTLATRVVNKCKNYQMTIKSYDTSGGSAPSTAKLDGVSTS